MRGKSGTAAGAVGNNLVAVVEKLFGIELLECPPYGFNVLVVVGDIGVFKISPEADSFAHILPQILILPNALAALVDKGNDAVLFDIGLAAEAELLFNLKLNGQTVRVPARLTLDVVTLHRAVPGDKVFD